MNKLEKLIENKKNEEITCFCKSYYSMEQGKSQYRMCDGIELFGSQLDCKYLITKDNKDLCLYKNGKN